MIKLDSFAIKYKKELDAYSSSQYRMVHEVFGMPRCILSSCLLFYSRVIASRVMDVYIPSQMAFTKICPQCGSEQHCRRSVCEKCGFVWHSKACKEVK